MTKLIPSKTFPLSRERALRGKAAELAIVLRFDTIRQGLGHDYGNGQRNAERSRRERFLYDSGDIGYGGHGGELVNAAYVAADITADGAITSSLEPLTALELREAFRRVATPRLARIEAEGYRADTPATRRTLRAWAELDEALAIDALLA